MSKARTRSRLSALLATTLLTLAACDNDSYDTGDGSLSYIRADFGEVHTSAAKTVDKLTTDDGTTVNFVEPASVSWATTPDSTYRSLVYYHDKPTGAEFYGARRVAVMTLDDNRLQQADSSKAKTDPLTLTSAWMAANKRYITLELAVKSGSTDDKATQTIGLMEQSRTERDDGTVDLRLLLTHDQGTVPEYYTVTTYMSMDIEPLPTGSTVSLTVNTYDGELVRTFEK